MAEPLLEIDDLRTAFQTEAGVAWAVKGVSLSVDRGETFALVGESGCGKSVTALSIMGLVPSPPGRIDSGSIRFDGRDLLRISARELRRMRGRRMSMIFQEPMTSLNPVFTIGNQLVEAARVHESVRRREARCRSAEMLDLVGITDARRRMRQYPHQLSGGMRQRVMIAMALLGQPDLMIADEPTTALDVTIQAQILDLLRDLQNRLGATILLITHNLGVVAEMADRVGVMYTGQLVETGTTTQLFEAPRHPYTVGLLESLPGPGRGRLKTIKGIVPSLLDLPLGCTFQDRCPDVFPRCYRSAPEAYSVGPGHDVRCFKYA
ncbi:MAG: ABC transporter ATP-binding protein [Proteobacteria bacterium]|nr:ABC transporter ATP-binding protein [Pseudomonadota bacterium]